MTINTTNPNYNFNLMQEIPTASQNLLQNLAKDKSQAVKEVLGYGVDSEGFFTSDLNEAAGIPKDYRIEVKMFEILEPLFTTKSLFGGKATHLSIDWAKTLGDFYQNSFKGSIKNEIFGESLSEEQYKNIFNDTRDWEEILKTSNNMASSKGFAFVKMFFESSWFGKIKGETNTNGKIHGLDNNISKEEYQNFRNFMNANQFDDPTLPDVLNQHNLANGWSVNSSKMTLVFQAKNLNQMKNKDEELEELSKMINGIKSDYFALLDKDDLSLEEFKTEYLVIKEKHDEFVKRYKEKMEEYSATSNEAENEAESENNSQFKAIQVTKKSETYQDLDSVNILEFIQSQQKLEQILLLLNQESNNEALNLKRFERFFKTDLGKLDIEI